MKRNLMNSFWIILTLLLQSTFISLLSFFLMDIFLLNLSPVEKSVGGEVDLLVVGCSCIFPILAIRLILKRLEGASDFLKMLASLLLYGIGLGAMLIFDFIVLYKLSGYREGVIMIQVLVLVLSFSIPNRIYSKIPLFGSLGILSFYLVFLFGIRSSGVITGDWLTLLKIQTAVKDKRDCSALLCDEVLYPKGHAFQSCQMEMIPLHLKFYPEAMLHFSQGKLNSYSLNWRAYD